MKKLCIVLLCLCLLPLPVMAETAAPAAELSAGWNLIVGNVAVQCENGLFVENDRLMASAQALCAVLDLPYTYNSGTFSIGDDAIVFKDGAAACYMGGIEIPIDVVARSVGNELYVPVRFLAETMGCKVDFQQEYGEDGSVYASVALVDLYQGPAFNILLPGDENVVKVFQVTAAISNADVRAIFGDPSDYQAWVVACIESGDDVVVFNNEAWTLTETMKKGLLDLTPYVVTHNPEVVNMLKDKAVKDRVIDAEGRMIGFPVKNGDNLEVFYVPAGCEDAVEGIIAFIDTYNQVINLLA
ncbi:MAG: hypothetical protein IKW06_01975 [Clostridia bacterium]|nr:hypothetical protein [Clostridia bacterium]